jgi:hypothetical protein
MVERGEGDGINRPWPTPSEAPVRWVDGCSCISGTPYGRSSRRAAPHPHLKDPPSLWKRATPCVGVIGGIGRRYQQPSVIGGLASQDVWGPLARPATMDGDNGESCAVRAGTHTCTRARTKSGGCRAQPHLERSLSVNRREVKLLSISL